MAALHDKTAVDGIGSFTKDVLLFTRCQHSLTSGVDLTSSSVRAIAMLPVVRELTAACLYVNEA